MPFHERDVEADELVKGWEFAKGQFVMVEESDLEAVALTRSQSIDIDRRTWTRSIPSTSTARTTSPRRTRMHNGARMCLLRAMQEANVAAIGKFVLWGKENLCLIRPLGESLALETLYYAEDIRAREEIDEAVAETEVQDAELEMARQLVASLVGEFEPEDFENEYRGALKAMLEAKLAGEEIVAPEQPAAAPVVDLMEALKESVAQAQRSKKVPEKKPAARKKRAASGSLADPASTRPVWRRCPSPRGAPGKGSCRSSPGRSGSTPRCTRG